MTDKPNDLRELLELPAVKETLAASGLALRELLPPDDDEPASEYLAEEYKRGYAAGQRDKEDLQPVGGWPAACERSYRRGALVHLRVLFDSPPLKEAAGWEGRADDAGRLSREVLKTVRALIAMVDVELTPQSGRDTEQEPFVCPTCGCRSVVYKGACKETLCMRCEAGR